VRDYLERIQWSKVPPAPPLPDDIAVKTSAKYKEAYSALTGRAL
jgi:phosphoribosylaminoimidazole-succinocarboxamide synthase